MRYGTIVIDPPWRYAVKQGLPNRCAGAPKGRRVKPTAEGQYPTNPEIAALPVAELAEPQAHLYLWITNPQLFTLLTWHKLGSPGMGFYFRGDTEHVIFATRGGLAIPAAMRVSNHFAARKGKHSVKPDRFYEMVERVSPGPRLEMFARRRRYGWDVSGDQAPAEQQSQAPMGLLP